MPASEELPLSYRVQDFIQKRNYKVGAAGTDFGYRESIHAMGVYTKAFFIFKPEGFLRKLVRDPPCIALLDISGKDWYLQVYGEQYREGMEILSILLGKEFNVQTYSKVLRDKPRNY